MAARVTWLLYVDRYIHQKQTQATVYKSKPTHAIKDPLAVTVAPPQNRSAGLHLPLAAHPIMVSLMICQGVGMGKGKGRGVSVSASSFLRGRPRAVHMTLSMNVRPASVLSFQDKL